MLKHIAQSISWPDWCAEDSRFWRLALNDLALTGKLYDRIKYPFAAECDKNGQFLSMWQRRPCIRLNLPAMASHILSRKLFGTKHAPHVTHDNPKVVDAVKWLIGTVKLDLKMLDAAFWGQSGSAVVTIMMVDGAPCAKVWQGKDCWRVDDEGGNMTDLIIAYCVDGLHWLKMGVTHDQDGDEIKADAEYWFIKGYDKIMVGVMVPPKYEKWNPVTGMSYRDMPVIAERTKPHGFEFIPAHWIKNLPGQDDPNCMDGAALFALTLDNAISMDYNLSQAMRGLNACSAPQVVIKGRTTNYDRSDGRPHVMGPSQTLNLPADRHEVQGVSVSGADAKLLEMSGGGIKISQEFNEKMHQFTLECMSVSRKNPDTVDGAMSGKAMELIDSEFIDLVEVGQVRYGKYGYLVIITMLATVCCILGIGPFAGMDAETFKELHLEWPKIYTASPQEAQFLITAVIQAIQTGLMEFDEGYIWLMAQLGKSSEQFDAVADPEKKGKKLLTPGELSASPVPPGESKPKPTASKAK